MFALIMAGLTGAAFSAAPTEAASPTVSRCELGTTQRVAFSIDNAPKEAMGSFVRISLYDAKNAWIADEIVFGGFDARILPVAGLLDPHAVGKVICAYNGYVSTDDPMGFLASGDSANGKKGCPQRDAMAVGVGPDAKVDAVVFGRDWIMMQLGLGINHFTPKQKSDLEGDVFRVSIDDGAEQKVVVSGSDPQSVAFLFTDLKPGFHQINYGPWLAIVVAEVRRLGYPPGYHNYCVKI